MLDPVFWLGVSILLVAVSIAAVLVAAMPAFRELARAARSAEKLFDTLSREMPPTLQSIRDTGAEISSLTGDMSEGVQGAGRVVQQVDQSVSGVTKKAQVTTRSMLSGVKAAWKTLRSDSSELESETNPPNDRQSLTPDRPTEPRQLPASSSPAVEIEAEKTQEHLAADAEVRDEVEAVDPELSSYSDSVAKLTAELEMIRDRLTQQKRGDVLNK